MSCQSLRKSVLLICALGVMTVGMTPALAPAAGWLGRGLASRLGSTLLVSNLGRLEPHGPVTAAAFYPSAHGRSGLSVGCVTVDETTTVTVRARRRDYTEQAAADLLADITGSLASPGT